LGDTSVVLLEVVSRHGRVSGSRLLMNTHIAAQTAYNKPEGATVLVLEAKAGWSCGTVRSEGEFEAAVGLQTGWSWQSFGQGQLQNDSAGHAHGEQFPGGGGDARSEEASGGIERERGWSSGPEGIQSDFGGELLDDGGGLFDGELCLPAAQGRHGDGDKDRHQSEHDEEFKE
jgi:hypothetical protein